MLARITGRTIAEEARNPTINVVLKARDRRRSWLGHILRMPEHRLVRRVLLKCVKPTHETLFPYVPNLNVDHAIRMSEDMKLWSSRPSLRVQPLQGGVAKSTKPAKKDYYSFLWTLPCQRQQDIWGVSTTLHIAAPPWFKGHNHRRSMLRWNKTKAMHYIPAKLFRKYVSERYRMVPE